MHAMKQVCTIPHTVTPLSKDESDAAITIFRDEQIKLDPESVPSLSLEELQQMLRERGLEELAINLKGRIDKGG